ncbi:hypothetical protein Nepgr_024537 [Nepenthes gracilis]|uniref:Hydroxyproline-rich glycoprotein family protein n=1 Tax=Nepenthes gracilis TaxID=150966 RepID=A0AAD3Y046_NEPGR|nr:hypothetical protein Nepgr_024537 [Nepenthes gracilis]
MRGGNGGIANGNGLEAINAAAFAIASAETRVPQATVQKRRWSSCWSIYWCFGSHKHSKRIGHAVLVPETTHQTDLPPVENFTTAQAILAPLVAPPSSPASFQPSEPSSAAQSPAGIVSLTSISANVYSPGGPRSIFAVGPYAHETQLVSPPVFSSFNTEPSTAPFTPPTESFHLTTPSSPEVPFAQLLNPDHQSNPWFPPSPYEFLTHLYPGSPVGQLISPGSAMSASGTSSPFPDMQSGFPPKLLSLELPSACEWGSRRGSGSLTPDAVQPKSCDSSYLDFQNATVSPLTKSLNGSQQPLTKSLNGSQQHEVVADHRVSFELTAEDLVRCVAKEPKALPKALGNVYNEDDEDSSNLISDYYIGETTEKAPADPEEGQHCQKQRSVSLGSLKEFHFDNTNEEDSHKPCIGSNWWANEKVASIDGTSNIS